MLKQDWQQTANEKRLKQRQAIDGIHQLLSSDVQPKQEDPDKTAVIEDITSVDDVATLAGLIASGNVSSVDVTKAYIRRAIKAHEKTNWQAQIFDLTEVLFEEAIADAKKLDQYLLDNGKPMGPFHGVPFTLKDQFNVKGYDTTLGYTGRSFKPAQSDAVLVKILRDLGGIIVAKTNLPQSIMWCETDNTLWGLTTNPADKRYTPGGSTGGEAALLSLNATTVGWGTDIGGSVRMPSHMMGVYGFKPSSSRLPYTGIPVSTEGQEHVPSSVGPMARSLSSIHTVMKEIIATQPWTQDCRCVPIPWRTDVYDDLLNRKLTIGILLDDGVVRPHPAVTRVIQEAADALEKAGHELVQWTTGLHAECIEVMDSFYTVDGGEDIRRDIEASGEPYIPHVESLVNRGKPISVYEYWQLNKRKKALQQAYLEKWDNIKSPSTGKPVDALLMPVMCHSAVPHRACRWVGYTKIWNVLDYTVLVLPGGRVESEDLNTAWKYHPRNDLDNWNAKLWDDNKNDMARMNLPIGVQLVGGRLEEEKILAIGKVLDALLQAKRK